MILRLLVSLTTCFWSWYMHQYYQLYLLILATNLTFHLSEDLPKTSFAAYRTRKFLTGIEWLGVISTRPRQSQARSSGWGSWSQRHGWNQELTVDDPNKIFVGEMASHWTGADWLERRRGRKKDVHKMVHVILCAMDPNCNLERIPLRYQIWNSAARQAVVGGSRWGLVWMANMQVQRNSQSGWSECGDSNHPHSSLNLISIFHPGPKMPARKAN